MPFTAAQLTAFWTDNAQMALSHRTRGQMAAEGLTVPADFVDFAEKDELEALLKRLYKPAKTTHGVGAAMVLREVQAYEVPARSVVRLHGVRVIVRYYNSVGRALEADDLFWNVVKNFTEQWKALVEKKSADVGTPPKLTKDKQVYKWLESIQQHLSEKIGVCMAPLTYLTSPDVAVPAVMLPQMIGLPFTENYDSIEEEMQFRTSHTNNLFKSDNNALFQILDRATSGHTVNTTIAPFRRAQNGRGAFLAIVDQHAGRHVYDKIVKDASHVLQARKWNGASSITLGMHTTGQRQAYTQLLEAAEHTPAEVPNPRLCVTYLLDSLESTDPKILAGVAAIDQDMTGKRVDFEGSVTFLLPYCPVTAKSGKTKGFGAKVSGTVAGIGAPTLGKTGVTLCWHEPDKFNKLSKEQKKEVMEWNRNNPKNKGAGKRKTAEKTERRTKARVASVKAQDELIEAMAESHSAEINAMKARLSSMSVPPGVPPTFHPAPQKPFADYEIEATAASLKLKGILKKRSEKATP